MDPRISDEVSITDLFDQFIEASTMRNVLSIYHRILNYADLNPCEFNVFFPKLKRAVMTNRLRKNWKAKALFSKIDKKAAHKCYSNTKAPTPLGNRFSDNHNYHNSQECLNDSVSSQSTRTYYNNNALQHYNCLIIGSGPAGLRTAIELQLLGANRVVVVEKRSRFSRNNVLHLWPFVIDDLKSLGAKKFYGKFCAGSIDHISIRQLQLILLKVSLLVGCDFRDSCSYLHLCPESIKQTQQFVNGNSGDNIVANGSSESTENKNLECDLDTQVSCMSDIYVKVSDSDKVEKNENPSEIKPKFEDYSETNQSSSKMPEIKMEKTEHRGENLHGARAHFESDYKLQEKELHSNEWDIIIGADGRRNTLSKFFPRKEFRGRLAIAITANFINRQTPAEASVSEISGLSFIYNQDMFNSLAYDTNIELENICYYKDDTHYFVMTAKKRSLLERGVLINDYAATQDLLSDSNIDRQALLKYAKDAAFWTTGLEPLDFALNHYGHEDCAMFDFTSMYAASNACKALRTKEGGLTLVSLVGDSLLEPFWPTGSGCARGFLSSFDAAWMCRQWAVNKCAVIDYHGSISSRSSRNRSPNPSSGTLIRSSGPTTYNKMALSVIAERESIYRILAQTTSENLQQNYSQWTLNPHTRYPNLNRHLVMPSQVEHLITDHDNKCTVTVRDKNRLVPSSDRNRRVKSPNNMTNSRKSPKKLKSANTSPMTQSRNVRGRAKSLSKTLHKPGSRHDATLDETYLEFEKSYNNLADYDTSTTQYLNHKRPDCDLYDDFFIPSLSGTLPSSNNLQHLEARRARDIDECLRQRRQKKQLTIVRDQLVSKLKGNIGNDDKSGNNIVAGNAALFNELRRLKEQQLSGKENKPKDVSGLTLLNSMRRCASFAERVKSFENKLSASNQESNVSTPKTPLDSVKNLPNFATLQELFVNNSTLNRETELKKSKIPIMKLSKNDWNVKCWEKRLAAHKQRTTENYYGSTKSLNKALSVESHFSKPERQVEVFKDRIKEMAEKLKRTRDTNQKLHNEVSNNASNKSSEQLENSYLKSSARSQGWVSHLRKELIRGTEAKRPQAVTKQPMNPVIPNKPIKKLFEDEDEDDDGIDINKHYDHLCINRPTNKYLSKNGYKSHLVRSKYDSTTSKVINRPTPTTESKQAYMATLTSRGSSASSTLSDYSTNTGGSSGSNEKQQLEPFKCFRCSDIVCINDKITIADTVLHRNCLTCGKCGIALRTNEIQHYLRQVNDDSESSQNQESKFMCAICKPNIRASLSEATTNRYALVESDRTSKNIASDFIQRRQLRSREDFLNERINYNEIYKNILEDNAKKVDCDTEVKSSDNDRVNSCKLNSPSTSEMRDNDESHSASGGSVDVESKLDDLKTVAADNLVSISPVTVTLPIDLDIERRKSGVITNCDDYDEYKIARTETIDGSEQVTIILPPSDDQAGRLVATPVSEDERQSFRSWPPTMIDEDELERINQNRLESSALSTQGLSEVGNGNATASSAAETSDRDDASDSISSSDEENQDDEEQQEAAELSDEPSSLNSPPNTENYDDIDDIIDQNSTYEDFLTSEEFGAPSDGEDEVVSISDSDHDDNSKSRLQQKVGISDG